MLLSQIQLKKLTMITVKQTLKGLAQAEKEAISNKKAMKNLGSI